MGSSLKSASSQYSLGRRSGVLHYPGALREARQHRLQAAGADREGRPGGVRLLPVIIDIYYLFIYQLINILSDVPSVGISLTAVRGTRGVSTTNADPGSEAETGGCDDY